MKAIVFFANGTEEVEALTPVDYLRRAGIEVLLVGIGSRNVTGSHGITVVADCSSSELDENTDFDMIVLPGGMPGTKNLASSEIVNKLIQKAAEKSRYLAAICAAPSILGSLGLLQGKKATCYPGFENQLLGAEIVSQKVVCDGKFITACGAGAANEFSIELIGALLGKEKGSETGKSVRFL